MSGSLKDLDYSVSKLNKIVPNNLQEILDNKSDINHNHNSLYFLKNEVGELLDEKVDKVNGKELSTNDFTDELKERLEQDYNTISLLTVYPIGSIYISVASTNPNLLFGGTWASFAAGKVLVGLDISQSEFNTIEEIGGSKTQTLTTSQLPSHTHIQNAHTHTINDDGHTHAVSVYGIGAATSVAGAATGGPIDVDTQSNTTGITINSTTSTNQNTGSGLPHNNLQPYIVVYMFKRTA